MTQHIDTREAKLLIRKYAAGITLLNAARENEKKFITKIAELEEKVEELETESESNASAKDAVDKAVEAVKKGAEVATSDNSDAMSDSAKDAIVEAVSRVDQDAATQLAEAIDEAGKVDSEKLAGMVIDVFRSIEGSASANSLGSLVPNGMGKRASRETAENQYDSVLDDLVHM